MSRGRDLDDRQACSRWPRRGSAHRGPRPRRAPSPARRAATVPVSVAGRRLEEGDAGRVGDGDERHVLDTDARPGARRRSPRRPPLRSAARSLARITRRSVTAPAGRGSAASSPPTSRATSAAAAAGSATSGGLATSAPTVPASTTSARPASDVRDSSAAVAASKATEARRPAMPGEDVVPGPRRPEPLDGRAGVAAGVGERARAQRREVGGGGAAQDRRRDGRVQGQDLAARRPDVDLVRVGVDRHRLRPRDREAGQQLAGPQVVDVEARRRWPRRAAAAAG